MQADKAAAILAALEGGMSLRKAAAESGITHGAVLQWVDKDAEFAAQYTRTRARAYQMLADEIIEISDESANDTYTDENGVVRTNQEVVARSRLRVDSRKWMLSKMLPKIYGDKLAIGGADDMPPIRTMPDGDLEARIAALQAQVNGKQTGP